MWETYARKEWWTPVEAGYDPGTLQGHYVGSEPSACPNSSTVIYGRALTNLTFTTPDGSEHYLYDEKTGGAAIDWQSCENWPAYGRGRVFSSEDGPGLTFIADLDVHLRDRTGKSTPSGAG